MIYAVIVYFSLLLILSFKYHKWVVFKYLVGVYLFSLATSLFLINNTVIKYDFSITAPLVFCVGISLLILPFSRCTPRIVFATNNPNFVRVFRRIGYILGCSFVLFMILGIPAITKALLIGALDIRNGENIDFISDLSQIPRYGCYILYYFHGISYMLLIMFFFSFVFLEKDRILSVLLLLSSLSAPYMGAMVGGRTNLIYWLLFFLMCVLIFLPYLNKKRKIQLFIPVAAILAILTVYFIATTNNRFENDTEMNSTESVQLYAGKSFINFCVYFDNINYSNFTLRRILPLTTSLIEGEFDLIAYRDKIEGATGYGIGTFYTLLGDLYVDLGFLGMFVYCVLYFIIVSGILKRKNVFSIENMIIMGILVQIPLQGLFYYSYWHTRASLSIIVSLIIAYLLKQARLKHKKQIVVR